MSKNELKQKIAACVQEACPRMDYVLPNEGWDCLSLKDNIGFDSMDMIVLKLELEKEFRIAIDDVTMQNVQVMDDVVNMVESFLQQD